MDKEFIIPVVARKNQFRNSIENPDNHLNICMGISRTMFTVAKYINYRPEILPITKFKSDLFKINDETCEIKISLNGLINNYTAFNTRISKNYNQIFINKFISDNRCIVFEDKDIDLTRVLFNINSFISDNANLNCGIILKGCYVKDEPFTFCGYNSQFVNLLSEPWFLHEELYCLGFSSIYIKSKEFIEFVKNNLFNIYYNYGGKD